MPKTNIQNLVIGSIGSISILFFILLTNPLSISVTMLLLLPLIVALTSYSFCKLFLNLFSNFKSVKIKSLSLVMSLGPTLVVLLGSLGQLGFQDLLLAVLLVSGMVWYIKRVQNSSY